MTLKSMICAGVFLTVTATTANAATFSYDYEVTSPSFGIQSIVGDFSTNSVGALTSLTGTVSEGSSSYNITNLLFGIYDQTSQVLDVAFQIGGPNYELRSTGSTAALTAEISSVGTISIQSVLTVPLPASAPLFGAAVLTLGLAGVGVKRKKAAAAAAA